jgi:hypothetical protein
MIPIKLLTSGELGKECPELPRLICIAIRTDIPPEKSVSQTSLVWLEKLVPV